VNDFVGAPNSNPVRLVSKTLQVYLTGGRVNLEKTIAGQLGKKFLASYGNLRLIAVFTNDRY
jgi:hypothetical protein